MTSLMQTSQPCAPQCAVPSSTAQSPAREQTRRDRRLEGLSTRELAERVHRRTVCQGWPCRSRSTARFARTAEQRVPRARPRRPGFEPGVPPLAVCCGGGVAITEPHSWSSTHGSLAMTAVPTMDGGMVLREIRSRSMQSSRRRYFLNGDRRTSGGAIGGRAMAGGVVAGWCVSPMVSSAGLPPTWLRISSRRAWAGARWDERWRL
jgi:hypothetical protein